MTFANRETAALLLAERLTTLRGQSPLILAIPRGAVPMGRVLADRLDGELDVVLVHKIGAPGNPELAIGAVSENGTITLAENVKDLGIPPEDLELESKMQLAALGERRRRYTPHRAPADPKGRVVVVVDDGVATGATMEAALRVVREAAPRRLIAAMAVAPPETAARLRSIADEVVCLDTPSRFWAVGQFFDDFRQVSDDEVITHLEASRVSEAEEIALELPDGRLAGSLVIPAGARGLVIFSHGSGSSRLSPRNSFVAGRLAAAGFATLLCDLLTEAEDQRLDRRFDIPLLTRRLIAIVEWASRQAELAALPIGLFGASTGSASALGAAAALGRRIAAVVSRGGRPDLALADLPKVASPTLLIVGERDSEVLELNRLAMERLAAETELEVVPRATHLFAEPGALERVAQLAHV